MLEDISIFKVDKSKAFQKAIPFIVCQNHDFLFFYFFRDNNFMLEV